MSPSRSEKAARKYYQPPAEGDAEPDTDGLGHQQSAPEPVPRPAYKPRRRREYQSDVDAAEPEEEDVAPQRRPPTMGQFR
jgi:hypothetical protein